MTAPIDDIPHDKQRIAAFTDLYACDAYVYVPRDEDDLRRIFAYATATGSRITFRAGGHSFDRQALSLDAAAQAQPHLVVSMTSFDDVTIRAHEREMTVGSGVTWGEILARLQPMGLAPYVTVTTAHATAGGTLAGDCLSRLSPEYGKEGHHIKSFRIMTLDGVVHTCTKPVGSDPTTLEERLFCGAIGGLGYFGAVTSITYELLDVGESHLKIGVASYVKRYRSFHDLAKNLVPHVVASRVAALDRARPQRAESVYSALYAHGAERYALLLTANLTPTAARDPMPQHQPDLPLRVVVEWLMRVTWLNPVMWRIFFWLFKENHEYIDDLDGFTFMMDGNVRAKHIAQSLGITMKAIQQTYVIPLKKDGAGLDGGDADERLAAFLEAAIACFASHRVEPTLLDVLYIPKDPRFFLSASTDMDGFAVSFAFETSDERRLATVKTAFRELAEICKAAHGRVYLVKNVHADPATLAEMYAHTLPRFVALKREVDPRSLIANLFLETNFPSVPSP